MESEAQMASMQDNLLPDSAVVLAIVNLGERDEGSITANHLPKTIDKAIDTLTNPEVKLPVTNRWRCVDGRGVVGAESIAENVESDPQITGGIAINETSVDIMIAESDPTLSSTTARNTRTAISRDQRVVVHGDNHTEDGEATNKGGCGGNALQRDMLRRNAANADIVSPIVFEFSKPEFTDIAKYWIDEDSLKDEITMQISRGLEIAENDAFWDIDPDGVVDVIIENGGEYEELHGPHIEAVTEMDLSEDGTKTDGNKFKKNNETVDAFIASIGHYKKVMMEIAKNEGRDELWAAKRVLATLLANAGTLKLLTKDIPVVVTK